MKRIMLGLLMLLPAPSLIAKEETLAFGVFGTIALYYETPQPSHVALFVSGDGGWNLGVVDMAKELAQLDALVVGTDIVHYLKELQAGSGYCSQPPAEWLFRPPGGFRRRTCGCCAGRTTSTWPSAPTGPSSWMRSARRHARTRGRERTGPEPRARTRRSRRQNRTRNL